MTCYNLMCSPKIHHGKLARLILPKLVHHCSSLFWSNNIMQVPYMFHSASLFKHIPLSHWISPKKTQQKSGQETHMRWENDSSSEFFWHSQHSYETWPIEIDHQEQLIIYHHLKWWFSIATSLLSENHQRLPIVYSSYFPYLHMGMGQNLVPLVNIKIAGK